MRTVGLERIAIAFDEDCGEVEEEVEDAMAGILVTMRTRPPESRMAVPVSAKGKQKPAALYSRAPRTGPTCEVSFVKFKGPSFLKSLKILRTILWTNRETNIEACIAPSFHCGLSVRKPGSQLFSTFENDFQRETHKN